MLNLGIIVYKEKEGANQENALFTEIKERPALETPALPPSFDVLTEPIFYKRNDDMSFNLRYSDDCHRGGSSPDGAQKGRRAQSLLKAYANAPQGGEGQALAHALASLRPIPSPREAIGLTNHFPAEFQSQALARFSAFLECQDQAPGSLQTIKADRLAFQRRQAGKVLAKMRSAPEEIPDWYPVAMEEPSPGFQVTPDRPTPPLSQRVRKLAQEAQETARRAQGFSAAALGKWTTIYSILAAHLPENEAREAYSNLIRIYGPAKRSSGFDWKTRQAEGQDRASDAAADREGGAE